jgi:hypothetical protein
MAIGRLKSHGSLELWLERHQTYDGTRKVLSRRHYSMQAQLGGAMGFMGRE